MGAVDEILLKIPGAQEDMVHPLIRFREETGVGQRVVCAPCETFVGGGGEVGVGEQQRVAIARLAQPPHIRLGAVGVGITAKDGGDIGGKLPAEGVMELAHLLHAKGVPHAVGHVGVGDDDVLASCGAQVADEVTSWFDALKELQPSGGAEVRILRDGLFVIGCGKSGATGETTQCALFKEYGEASDVAAEEAIEVLTHGIDDRSAKGRAGGAGAQDTVTWQGTPIMGDDAVVVDFLEADDIGVEGRDVPGLAAEASVVQGPFTGADEDVKGEHPQGRGKGLRRSAGGEDEAQGDEGETVEHGGIEYYI